MLNLFFIGKFLTHIFFLKFKDKLILLGNAHSVSFKKYWPQKRILNSFNILLLTKYQFFFMNCSLEAYSIFKILKQLRITPEAS